MLATAIRDFEDTKSLPLLSNQFPEDRWRLVHGLPNPFGITDDKIRNMVFHTTSTRSPPPDPLRTWLKRILPMCLAWSARKKIEREGQYWAQQTTQEISPFADKLARFLVAMAGGLSPVVPMLVPMLVIRIYETTRSMVMTSVAVVLFSGATAFVFSGDKCGDAGCDCDACCGVGFVR